MEEKSKSVRSGYRDDDFVDVVMVIDVCAILGTQAGVEATSKGEDGGKATVAISTSFRSVFSSSPPFEPF